MFSYLDLWHKYKMIKRLNKKGFVIPPTQIVMAITVLAGVLTILSISGLINIASIIGQGDYIDRPVFYYDKCEATSSYKYSTDYLISTYGMWLNKPSVTNQYDIKVKIEDLPFSMTQKYQIVYAVCNSKTLAYESNCRIYSGAQKVTFEGQVITISNVRNDEYVWAQFQTNPTGFKWKGYAGASYQVGWTPYGIRSYNVLGGSGNQVVVDSCTYPSTQRDSIIFTNADKVNDAFRGIDRSTNERVLQPEEVRWNVAGYLTSKAESFELRYSGQDAWCRPTGSTGEIYAVNTIQTSGGTYKIASVDWSDYLGSVACCPKQIRGDEVCNSNFEWEIIQGSECGIFKSCGSPNWVPYTTGQVIKYICVNGYCEQEIKEVECASDYDCKDANQLCDLNTWTCAEANVNLEGEEIITIPDSEAKCIDEGGKWITEQTEKRTLFTFIGLAKPKLISESYCKMPSKWSLAKILIIAGILLVAFLFRNQILAGIKLILSKVGIRI